MPGRFYVCEAGGLPIISRLAGPFDSLLEAQAAAGAIEAEHRDYQARTDIWQCPLPESEPMGVVLPVVGPSVAQAPVS